MNVDPTTKEYIDDQVRLSTDSSIKAVTTMLSFLQTSLNNIFDKLDQRADIDDKKHEEFKQDMLVVVRDEIQNKVNGKIDRLSAKFDILINDEDLKEILKNHKENKIALKVVKNKGDTWGSPIVKTVLTSGSLIVAWESIKSFLVK
jgi:hypothetical protein